MQGLPVLHGHAAWGHGDLRVQVRIDLLTDHVLRQADDDGPGPARAGGEHGLGHDLGGALRVVQDHHALRTGAEPGVRVELLEGLAVAVLERDQADEQDERRRVLPRGVQADVGVRGARAARHHGDAGDHVHLAVGLGHVRGAALVAAHHVLDARVVQAVQDVQVGLARHGVDALHAVGLEGLDDDVPGGEATGRLGGLGHGGLLCWFGGPSGPMGAPRRADGVRGGQGTGRDGAGGDPIRGVKPVTGGRARRTISPCSPRRRSPASPPWPRS